MKIIHEIINRGKGFYGDSQNQLTRDELLRIYDETRSISSIILTTSGTSGPATYNSVTGALNIPNYTQQAVTGFVPYIGATQNVNLGDKILATDAVQYSLLPVAPNEIGRLRWNPDRYTLDLGMGLGGSIQQIGMETYYTPVKNQTGSVIPDGTFVMATGSLGASGRMTIAPAITDGSVDSRFMLGVTTHDIADGGDGLVTWFGEIRGFNTNTKAPVGETWVDGTVLWNNPSVAGGFTSVEPVAPNLKIPVAIVISAGNNGVIFVRPRLGMRLTDLHDVNAFTPSSNDLIAYNGTKWEAVSRESVVLNTPLTGYTVGSNTALASTDTILGAFGKVQGQINAKIGGTIASGQVAFGTAANTIGGVSNFTFNSTTGTLVITNSTGASIQFNKAGFDSYSFFQSAGTGLEIRNVTDGRVEFFLDGTGRVGIATTSPTNTLDVNGTARVRTINNLGYTATEFLTQDPLGVIHKRTAAEVLTDIGAQAAGNFYTLNYTTNSYASLFNDVGGDLNNMTSGAIFASTNIANKYNSTNSTVASFVTSLPSIYGFQISGRNNSFGIRSAENGTWQSWNALITDAQAQTISGVKTFNNTQVFVGEIQSKQPTGSLSFGMFEGNTATRTWGIYNVNSDHDLGIIRYGGAGNRLMFSIDRTTNAGFFWGNLTIGTTTFSSSIKLLVGGEVTGGINSYGVFANPTIQSDVTNTARIFQSAPTTQATAFTLTALYHFIASPAANYGAGSTVTSQYGFIVGSGLSGATNNYGFYSDLASGAGRWNIFMAGDANNYLAGNLWLGLTAGTEKLDVNGRARIRTIDNATGDFVTASATGVLQKRTASETLADIGGIGGTIASGQVAFGTGANTIGGDSGLVWDNVNKRLGIGITPNQTLDLAGSISLGDRGIALTRSIGLTAFNNFGGNSSHIRFVSQSSTVNGLEFYINGAYGVRFYSGGSELYRFDNVGRLGLLTTSPTNTLDVNGTARIRTINNLGYTATEFLTQDPLGVISKRTASETLADIGAIGGTIASGQVAFATGTNTIGGDSGLTWNNTNKTLDIGSGGTARKMFLTSSGSLGSNYIDFVNTTGRQGYIGYGNSIDDDFVIFQNKNSSIRFVTNATTRWSVLATGVLQSTGTQTIQTSTGNLTLATAGGNGNILLTPDGTGFAQINKTTDLSTFALLRFQTTRAWQFQTVNNGATTRLELADTTGGKEFRIIDSTLTDSGFAINPRINSIDTLTGLMQIRTLAGNGNIAISPHGTGSVGVKTTSPTNTLDVNGTARIRTSAYIASDSGNVILGGLVDTGLAKLQVNGDATITNALLSNQSNTDVDSLAPEVVAQVSSSVYTAVFFDYIVKNGTNLRAGTVYAAHDGTNVVFTETMTQDLGDTSGVDLNVDLSGGQIRLVATVATDNWSIKTLIRGL